MLASRTAGRCTVPCAPLLTNRGTSAPPGVTMTTTGSVSHHCAPALALGAVSWALSSRQQPSTTAATTRRSLSMTVPFPESALHRGSVTAVRAGIVLPVRCHDYDIDP